MTKIMCAILSACSLLVALGGCNVIHADAGANRTAVDFNTPGWTGRTLIGGSRSTVAGDAQATYLQQKWGASPQL
jgi:hypothetical protein